MDLEDVTTMLNVSHMTIYRLEKRGEFPARRKITGKKVGWLASEVREWLAALPKVEA
nr:AlpA family phage regulatory protein [Geomonas sp. Red32]